MFEQQRKFKEKERFFFPKKHTIMLIPVLSPKGMWAQNVARPGESWGNARDWWIHSCTLSSHKSTAKMWITRYVFTFCTRSPVSGFIKITCFTCRHSFSLLICLCAVGGELRLSLEEPVLSGSPWDPWQRTLRWDHGPQPGPTPN